VLDGGGGANRLMIFGGRNSAQEFYAKLSGRGQKTYSTFREIQFERVFDNSSDDKKVDK